MGSALEAHHDAHQWPSVPAHGGTRAGGTPPAHRQAGRPAPASARPGHVPHRPLHDPTEKRRRAANPHTLPPDGHADAVVIGNPAPTLFTLFHAVQQTSCCSNRPGRSLWPLRHSMLAARCRSCPQSWAGLKSKRLAAARQALPSPAALGPREVAPHLERHLRTARTAGAQRRVSCLQRSVQRLLFAAGRRLPPLLPPRRWWRFPLSILSPWHAGACRASLPPSCPSPGWVCSAAASSGTPL